MTANGGSISKNQNIIIMKILQNIILFLIMAAIVAIPIVFTVVFFSLAEGTTAPEFMYFCGLVPWLLIVPLACIRFGNKK